MPTTAESVYSATSPPFILDSDMPGRLEQDTEYSEFFDSNLPLDAGNSPGIFSADDYTNDNSQFFNFGSPNSTNHKSPLPSQRTLLDTKVQPSLSAPSTASPAGSYQDSSSDSSGYKRKSSSDSSRSALTSGDAMTTEDAEMGDWKMEDMINGNGNGMNGYSNFDGTINPSSMNNNFEFSDKSMENDFDFESAASSPSPFGVKPVDMESPEMPTIRHEQPRKHTPAPKTKFKNHRPAHSQHSVTQGINGLTTSGSRETSPLSAMVTSHESSPTAFFGNSPSPGNGLDFISGTMLGGQVHTTNWGGLGDFSNHGLPQPPMQHPHMQPQHMPRMPQGFQNIGAPFKPILTVHPTPLKSRVETQIPIKLTLFPVPVGITKLHLPIHTVSKPKLLSKPPHERPDRKSVV